MPTYHSDVAFLDDCNPELIERNAAEFGRMRSLLDSLEPSVDRARGVRWESRSREGYDSRLADVSGLVTHLSEGFGLARGALLRYADEVDRARGRLEDGGRCEERLAELLSSVSTVLSRLTDGGEPMRRWEDARESSGFLDRVGELGMDVDSIRDEADRAYSDADQCFTDARRIEAEARWECLARLAKAKAALPDFRGGDFADAAELTRLVDGMDRELAQADRDPHARLVGGERTKNPFPAGDRDVSPALQQIRDQLKGLPEGQSSWLSDEWGGPDGFIGDNRELIDAAARAHGIPPDMLAGIAWQEVGGKPYLLDDLTDAVRAGADSPLSPIGPESLPGPLAGDRDNTSFGPMAVQTRRAAEVLGYDPAHLTDGQRAEIQSALKDPAQNLFISSKYLANVKAESEFADVPAERMTDAQYRELAARYNGGPYYSGDHAQGYADAFMRDRDAAARALGG